MKKVAIVNCGVSNLTSVRNAFDVIKIDAEIVDTPERMDRFSHIVIPGVGSYKQGMDNIRGKGFVDFILKEAAKGKPILGICLGMQLLATSGEEFGPVEGLEIIPGRVKKIGLSNTPDLRLPHVGWNDVIYTRKSPIWEGIEEGTSFYFTHSYVYADTDKEHVIGQCEYGEKLIIAIQRDNVCGVQFHPEKSQKPGLQLLKNFVALC
jgi:glutamine amidotransferase